MAIAKINSECQPLLIKLTNAVNQYLNYSEQVQERKLKEAKSNYENQKLILATLCAIALLLAMTASFLITRNITNSLGAEPDDLSDVVSRVASGDLTIQLALKPGDNTSVMAAVAKMQDSLSKVVSVVRQGSEGVATASSQIAQGNQDLSSRTESQASALQQTASSMEELGSTVRQNAENASLANKMALNASSVAIQGGEVVNRVVNTMKDIHGSSQKIADITSVIDSIAFQTNILALNAAVEAARAGDQGRGFAVVASEVRNLAQRSAEAAKEIKGLITESVNRVEQGTQLVDKAGQTMNEIVESVRRVTSIMSEISAASNEQANGVSQVATAVSQMDQATQQNAALVEEMAAAAVSLKTQAIDLVHTVSEFKISSSMKSENYTSQNNFIPSSNMDSNQKAMTERLLNQAIQRLTA